MLIHEYLNELPPATQELILELSKAMADFARGKLLKRSAQYATSGDGLRNLRHCEDYDIPTEVGLIVRMSDKMQRILQEMYDPAIPPTDLGQSDHGVDNNDLPDLINYCALLYAVRVLRSAGPETPKRAAGFVTHVDDVDAEIDATVRLARGIGHPGADELK